MRCSEYGEEMSSGGRRGATPGHIVMSHTRSEHKGGFKCTIHFVNIYMLHSNEYQLWQHNGLLEILCLQDQFF